jgi:dihydrofolate reductase
MIRVAPEAGSCPIHWSFVPVFFRAKKCIMACRDGRAPFVVSMKAAAKGASRSKGSTMRKLTAGLFHSVDGVVEAPFKFQFDSFDDELGAVLGQVMASTDTVILGRVGYEEWAGYWPNAEADQEFGGFINTVPKWVASRTLKGKLGWQNSTLIEGELEAFMRDLKARSGGDIAIMCSISLVRQLLFAGLLDELALITHPVVAGAGRHLFEPTDPTTRLTLVRSLVTSKGNVVATYGLRE